MDDVDDRDGADGGVDTAADADGFTLLGDGTRLAVVRELARGCAESPHDPALPFSTLRERLGNPDSGTFNYHLSRLRGRFVERSDAGYTLTPAGLRLAAAIATGAYRSTVEIEPTELGDPCPVCGEPLSLSYLEGVLRVGCPAGHAFRDTLPDGAVRGRSVPEVARVFDAVVREQIRLAVDRICPLCYGDVETRVFELDASADVTCGFEGVCARCGALVRVPVGLAVADHPAVVALYAAHGIDLGDRPVWSLAFTTDRAASVVATDPIEVRVRIELGGDRVTLGLDADGSVSVVERPE